MSRFNTLLTNKLAVLSEALPPGGAAPSMTGSPMPPTSPGSPGGGDLGLDLGGPGAGSEAKPEVKTVTENNRQFLIAIALKALAFDPNDMSPQDKGIFDEKVSKDNAERLLKRIREIVGGPDDSISDEQG